MNRRSLRAPGLLLIALLVGACAAAGGTTSPTASPPPAGPLTASEAAALVLATDARFAGIGPQDPNVIGQDRWYEVGPGTTGFTVTVTIGWGDCPSGCINRHVWRYEVTPDRSVRLVEETGAALPEPVRPPVTGEPGVAGRALAGPVCPVVSDPPDPACADRPVAGAVVVVRDAGDAEVARATTGADGTYAIALAAGDYTVVALPVEGLMGTPEARSVSVPGGLETPVQVDLVYDTGIR